MKVVACIDEPAVVKRILLHLGLPAEPLPRPRKAPRADRTR
jgi:hypothetical protein